MEAAHELQPEETPAEKQPVLRLAYLALTDPAHWLGELALELSDEDVGA